MGDEAVVFFGFNPSLKLACFFVSIYCVSSAYTKIVPARVVVSPIQEFL